MGQCRVKLAALSGPPLAGVTANVSQRANGWTAGTGVEYMIYRHISVGLEYDYVRLSSADFSSTASNASAFTVNRKSVDEHMVLARASYNSIGREAYENADLR